ncbi:MAG: hypothetical protein Tsb0013_07680 [Phycisphaerales bacterium]
MGLFGGSKKPDKRLLILDDDFTRKRKPRPQILAELKVIPATSLSGEDEQYRQRLIAIMQRAD